MGFKTKANRAIKISRGRVGVEEWRENVRERENVWEREREKMKGKKKERKEEPEKQSEREMCKKEEK
jgi:hypothetical protein